MISDEEIVVVEDCVVEDVVELVVVELLEPAKEDVVETFEIEVVPEVGEL